MKITVAKVKKELEKSYGWSSFVLNNEDITLAIKETLIIVDEILKYQKNISIKK